MPKPSLEENIRNPGYLAYLEERLRHHVALLARYAEQLGLPAYPEDSADRCCRLWFFLEEFHHFLKVKRFLQTFLEKAPGAAHSIVVEPALPTRPVGIGWVEHPLALPLGVQKSNLRRSLFLNSEGEPVGEQLKFLRKIRPLSVGNAMDRLRAARVGQKKAARPVDAMPRGTSQMLRSCAVLREISEKAQRGRILNNEEKVIVFYTLGIADRGGESVHQLLEPCPDYNYEKINRQAARLTSNPISCIRIRELIPELTASVSCQCSFDLRGGKYPSPVLHADPHLVPEAQEHAIAEGIAFHEATRRYVRLRQQAEEINQSMRRLEGILDKHFERKKIDELSIDGLLLRRVRASGETQWEMERK